MAKQAAIEPLFYLVVHSPFENYQRGDEIKDTGIIEKILNSNQIHFVNKVSLGGN